MAKRQHEVVEVDRIFLYEENPRHEPLETEDEVIEQLCKDEQVYNLARSIAEAGTNPLELSGVISLKGSGKGAAKKAYQVWEGNRRVCAIKLLNDPDRSPPHLRRDFARLAAGSYTPVRKLPVVVFDDHDDLKYWMAIIHGGVQEGVGRRSWDAQQKQRHFGSDRNKAALAILDASQAFGFISKEEREGKLTTVQRFLNRTIVQDAIGIDAGNKDDITYNRPLDDLKKQLARFIGDLKRGVKVTSRHNRDQVDAYGRDLARNTNISGDRIQPLSLSAAATAAASGVKKPKRAQKPKRPKKKDHIAWDKTLSLALENSANDKLQTLYYSLCSIRLEAHCPLVTIGMWAFIESLAAWAGKGSEVGFPDYFSNQRLSDFGLGHGKGLGPIREALTRISKNGNATKHHQVSAAFDGKQLANDVATITPLLLKTLESIASKK